jgi:hypothetical protein
MWVQIASRSSAMLRQVPLSFVPIIEVDLISCPESQPFETEHHEIAAIERNHIGRHMAGIPVCVPRTSNGTGGSPWRGQRRFRYA